MIIEVPLPTTVRDEPEMLMTDAVAEEYENEPARDPVTEGAVTGKDESPKFLETLLQAEKVGVALLIVTVPET